MDFSQRSSQPAASRTSGGGPAMNGSHKKSNAWRGTPTWLRVVWIVLLFSITVLVVSIAALLYTGGERESKLVDKGKFQAIFLGNGQVYFGNIVSVNDKFVDLKNIYYLSVSQAVQPEQDGQQQANVSLIKLGCELHGPVDQMVVNRDQITFWENLRTDGQVSQAIDKWVQQNPNGQTCNTGNAQSSLDLSTALKQDS